MAKASSERGIPRPPRVKLAGTVLSLVRLENGRQTRGRLHQLSVTGGLLQMEQPLDEGIKVEVIFTWPIAQCAARHECCFPCGQPRAVFNPSNSSTSATKIATIYKVTYKDCWALRRQRLSAPQRRSPKCPRPRTNKKQPDSRNLPPIK